MTVWGVATPITELGEERVRGVHKIEELFGGRGRTCCVAYRWLVCATVLFTRVGKK
jgi:hypothetical protein